MASVGEKSKAETVKASQDKRVEIRHQIRDRDTVQRKWLALAENIRAEDHRRDQFYKRKHLEDTKSIPLNVIKFIGSLKKAVRNIMRHKGGTPYSIVRSLFIYWDAAKTGTINSDELLQCMKSLGVRVTPAECGEIVQYYRASRVQGDVEMDYHHLLQDLQQGEPSVIAFVSEKEDEERDRQEIRFEEESDHFKEQPVVLKKFLEAVRSYLAKLMRNQGGTPYQHIHDLFAFYDYDFSGGLSAEELISACRRKMKFIISEDQAQQIVAFYDRKRSGEISYDHFLKDVCADVKPILSFTDLSPRQIAASKASLKVNPFIPKPFQALENKVLETYKRNVKIALINKVNKLGGTVASWIREAFVTWDPFYTGKISDWRQLQGASKRLGVNITEEEAKELIHCYDRFHTNEMHYNYLTKEIMEEDPHFLVNGKIVDTSATPTQRTPKPVMQLMNAVKKSVQVFVKKSKGQLQPRDLFHGSFVRYDTNRSGRVNRDTFLRVLQDLKVPQQYISDNAGINACVKWFDTNGTEILDYHDMTRQIFGSDVTTEPLDLPPVRTNKSLLGRSLSTPHFRPGGSDSFAHSSSSSATNTLSAKTLHVVPEGFVNPSYSQTTVGSLICDPKSVTENPYMSTSHLLSLQVPTEFSLKASTLEKNLEKIESPTAKRIEKKLRKNKIILEKLKIEQKIQAIEEQRKKLIEDHKARHRNQSPHA
eukprot:CAMPEP_0173146930 /NCGR_PEP_ID=MMETSP1105-20130129/8785_1 /TAXON_ID=2985 /ORGANISM="Ochromonas sp., Strain BG-1" /LENGTH=706 /DNA_ID=CAMNT_0014061223 /DNA_START=27 /DNA_END=2147 /DNA_ORIENTATION=-